MLHDAAPVVVGQKMKQWWVEVCQSETEGVGLKQVVTGCARMCLVQDEDRATKNHFGIPPIPYS
jgi:hypothetical protein